MAILEEIVSVCQSVTDLRGLISLRSSFHVTPLPILPLQTTNYYFFVCVMR